MSRVEFRDCIWERVFSFFPQVSFFCHRNKADCEQNDRFAEGESVSVPVYRKAVKTGWRAKREFLPVTPFNASNPRQRKKFGAGFGGA